MTFQQGMRYTAAELVELTRTYAERARRAADALEQRPEDAPYSMLDVEADHVSRVLTILEFEMIVHGI